VSQPYVPPTAEAIAAARAHLAAADPALARLHEVTPRFEWRLRPGGFFGLARLIIAQQVSLASAEAIWSRLEAGLGEVAAAQVLACGEPGLLQYGLSRPKARYLHALAEAAPELEALKGMDDAEAIAALTALKGIGRWTAETYLMFCEGRLDVFPAGDVALQEAMRWVDRADDRPDEKAAYARAERWTPYRGVAAHLLWACYGAVKRGEIPAFS
jgi:DNA-3-methyladenine glycosylase II